MTTVTKFFFSFLLPFFFIPRSILGRIIRVTDDVIEYRRWIQCNFPLPVGQFNGRYCPPGLSETCDLSGSPSPPEERKSSKPRV